jgi:hypothetical protein
MEKFFVIPPINHMDLIEETECKTAYCLAHLCLKEKNEKFKEYKQFFIDKVKQGYHVILDNSAAEGDLVSEELLIQLTKEILPTEVVAIDYLFDSEKTLSALDSFYDLMVKNNLQGKVKIHAVAQGNSPESYMECYLRMLNDKRVDVIGLSKISVPKSFCGLTDSNSVSVNRIFLIKKLHSLGLIKKPLHCLGMRNITEFKAYKNINNIRSTDSCYTILSAYNYDLLNKDVIVDHINETPHDYFFYNLNDEQLSIAKKNIKQLYDIIKNDEY